MHMHMHTYVRLLDDDRELVVEDFGHRVHPAGWPLRLDGASPRARVRTAPEATHLGA